MKNRTAVALMGLLGLVCSGLVLSIAYPFSISEPHAANSSGERFSVGTGDAYSATGRIVVDGEVRLAFEGVVTADGAWYQRIVDDDVVSEAYQSSANGTVYHKHTMEGDDEVARQRELIAESEVRELVRTDRDGDRVTVIVEENGTGATQPVSGTASVVVNSLFVAGYEGEGAESSGETVFEPRSGWYDGRQTYRISDASGEVHVDDGTYAVTSANVSWDMTVPAGTYAEYTLVRLIGDEPTSYRITFEFDPGDSELERPSWVGDASSSADD